MRICQCTRHVQENSVCLPILCPKFRSCHAKFRGRWESSEWWKIHRIGIVNEAFVTWAWSCASVMHSTWLVQTSNTYLENNAGQIVRHQCYQLFTKCYVTKWSFSKISRDPSRGFSWWRENKLFQVNAHLPVQTPCPGKFCLPSNFVSKVSFMPRKISRSLRVIRMMKNTSDWHRKRSFRDLGVILRVSNAFYMACSDKQYLFRE